MKLIALLFAILISVSSQAAFNSTPSSDRTNPSATQTIHLTDLTVKQLESILERKLTLKEKVQWFVTKKIVRLTTPDDEVLAKKARSNAYVGFGLSLAGIFLLPLLAIPAIIISNQALSYEKRKPGSLGSAKGYAQAGKIIGWVGIGLLALILLLIIVFAVLWNQ